VFVRVREAVKLWAPRGRARVVGGAVLLAIATLLAHHALYQLTRKQVPGMWHDSLTFNDIAAQPLSLAHLFYPKPFMGPFVERLVGDPSAIARFQIGLDFAAWAALAIALVLALRTWRARVIGVVACGAFVLAPARVGFMTIIASEPIDDALRTFAIALAVALLAAAPRPKLRNVLAAAFVVVTAAWIFTRDTNAIIALSGIALCARRLRGSRWAIATAAAIGIAAVVSLWSSQVVPRQPLGIRLTEGWAPESTKRGSFALVDDFMIRVMPDPDARKRAIADGMPWSAELEQFVGTGAYGSFLSEDRYKPTRDWIFAHGTATYVGWLARHPIARLEEVVAISSNVLTPQDIGAYYMRAGWRGNDYGGAIMKTFRTSTESSAVVLVLIICVPLAWRRIHAHPLAPAIAVLAWSAVIGVFAAYYGDAMEMVRHAWGASQQLIVALVLAVVVRVDGGIVSRDGEVSVGGRRESASPRVRA
jgi:hypothetical protein